MENKIGENEKMKFSRNKTMTATIALVLMLTTITSVAILTPVNAQDYDTFVTHIYVCTSPLSGVGQQMFIITWTDDMPPDIGETILGSRASWSGQTVEITAPDGTKQTIDMGDTDPVGGTYALYTPTQVGDYTVKAFFPGTWKNHTDGSFRRWYTPSESGPTTFTVQVEPIPGWNEPAPTTDFWTRPLAGPTHWADLVGNWLGGSAQKYPMGADGGETNSYGYGQAPASAHVLWTRVHYPSGSLSDQRFPNEVATLNHYQDVDWDGNIILDGVIHSTPQYTAHWGPGAPQNVFGWEGWDLYTGEQLFFEPYAQKPAFGMVYLYNSPNQHGTFSYLWRTSDVELPEYVERLPYFSSQNETVGPLTTMPGTQVWEMIDAYTLNRVCYVANVSTSGNTVIGKDGSYYEYRTVNLGTNANPNYYLQVYNMSAIRTMLAGDPAGYGTYGAGGTEYWQWRPQWGGHSNYNGRWRENVNAFHDFNDQIFFVNASIQSLRAPTNSRQNQTASIRVVREGEYIICAANGVNDDRGIAPAWLIAFSLEPGKEGQKLWESTFNPPYAEDWGSGFSPGMALYDIFPNEEVVVFNNRIELTWFGYDMKSGQMLWQWDNPNQFGYYALQGNYYDGQLLAYSQYGGEMYSLNLRTGTENWVYLAESTGGTESPYGRDIWSGTMIADGKIYMTAGEHSGSTPAWRGDNLRCINATTGEEIWTFLFWGQSSSRLAVSDGILVSMNWYDGSVYAFGRGPSGTTVTAPDVAVPLGTTVMLKGTVTDQTPTGRRNINNELQFSLKGTPAISDEDMTAWMEYKFMGQTLPMNAKGVTVKLTAIDPNGNLQDIGEVTSDMSGNFGMDWVPPVPGKYQITASFDGSNSYGPSSSMTYFYVDQAPSPGAPIEPEPTTPEPTTPEPTTPEPTTPEPTEPAEAPFITTEIAILAAIAVACVIGVVSFWALRKRK